MLVHSGYNRAFLFFALLDVPLLFSRSDALTTRNLSPLDGDLYNDEELLTSNESSPPSLRGSTVEGRDDKSEYCCFYIFLTRPFVNN